MSNEHWLITGALGCVGAWCCRQLVREGHTVVGLELESDRRRAKLIVSGEELAAVEFVRGDITDLSALERLLSSRGVTHVVHLAAMLIPLAAGDPPRGALVNVVGTVNVFEAAKRRGGAGLAYASSAAVYDRADGVRVAEDADGHPASHYGVHKQANEGAARVYWRDDGLASVGLSLGGPSEDVTDVVAAIESVAPGAAGKITVKEDVLLPPPEDMEASQPVTTPLRQGVLETIERFRRTPPRLE
jgi:UDP-glucuronate 4-epimerase